MCKVIKLVIMVIMTLSCVVNGSGFPDLSWDFYTEDIVGELNPAENRTKAIVALRDMNGDLPIDCRSDVCPAAVALSYGKGRISVKKTTVGHRFYVRCPYSVEGPMLPGNAVYAYRECLLDRTNTNATWGIVHARKCPQIPIFVVAASIRKDLPKTEPGLSGLENLVHTLATLIRRYPDIPSNDYLNYTLVHSVFRLIYGIMTIRPDTIDEAILQDSMDLADHFLNETGASAARTVPLYLRAGILQQIARKCSALEVAGEVKEMRSFQGRVRCLRRSFGVSGGVSLELISQRNYSVNVHVPPRTAGGETSADGMLTFVYFAKSSLLYDVTSDWVSDVVPTETIEKVTLGPIGSFGNDSGFPGFPGFQEDPMGPGRKRRDLGVTKINGSGIISDDDRSNERDIKTPSGLFPEIGPTRRPTFTKQRPMTGPVILVNVQDTDAVPVITYQQTFEKEVGDLGCSSTRQHQPNESQTIDSYDLSSWHSSREETCESAEENLTLSCVCRGQGYFSSFGFKRGASIDSSLEAKLGPGLPSISEFVGFPYSTELHITGHVLRAVSLVCLIITILSYAIFKKARKGRPTSILLNLCVSLVLLIVVLYVGGLVVQYRVGCTVLNAVRYHLILASLLWNATEAYNMYLMLIKVFDADVSRLVLKAEVVAWGLPALGVGVVFAVDTSGFDGRYIDCTYRCVLRDHTLYYAFLLPLALIITHNLVVFAMVLKVICTNTKFNKDRRGYVVRLMGALAMLVLLGVPWIFSAFGAMDGQNDSLERTEGVFQVVFVVLVNLQGLFIFIFHTARNKDIRDSWRTTISTGRIKDSRSSAYLSSSNVTSQLSLGPTRDGQEAKNGKEEK